MKKLFSLILVVLFSLVLGALALAADPATIAAPAAAAPAGPLAFLQAHSAVLLGALLAISEVLALIPSVRSNGIFDAIYKGLQALTNKGNQ